MAEREPEDQADHESKLAYRGDTDLSGLAPHLEPMTTPMAVPGPETLPTVASVDFVLQEPLSALPTLAELSAGTTTLRVQGYELLEEVGRGGMGIVYRARQKSLGRIVALKALPPIFAGDPERLARFRNEAAIVGGVAAVNIVPVFDIIEADGVPILVMPFIEGANLATIIRDRREYLRGRDRACRHPWTTLPPEEFLKKILNVLDQLVEGVTAIHAAGVLHRDIKPSNVLVDPREQAWIADFGLARLSESGLATSQGLAVGTPGYMSPEQADASDDLDARVDVFSTGVTIYQALTLELPYGQRHVERTTPLPVPPSRKLPLLPKDFDNVVLKALAPQRDARYRDSSALREDWKRVRHGLTPAAPPIPRRRFATTSGTAAWATSLFSVGAILFLLLAMGPRTSPARLPDSYTVVLPGLPENARAVLVPLDPDDGSPRPSKRLRGRHAGDGTFVFEQAQPGPYYVVADLPGTPVRFVEAFRTVPRPDETPKPHPHRSWKVLTPRRIEVPPLSIARGDSPEWDMVLFLGAPRFRVGMRDPPRSAHVEHERKIDPFFLDTTEVTFGHYLRVMGRLPAAYTATTYDPHEPVCLVTFDEAVEFAERVGKRLPTEVEYEYAATMGGTRQFPWGDDFDPSADWVFGRAGEPAFDRTRTDPPVFGLYSNVAEWTTSWGVPYPNTPIEMWRLLPPLAREHRSVRGGSFDVCKRVAAPTKDPLQGTRYRHFILRDWAMPGLGFRCARSLSPPYLP